MAPPDQCSGATPTPSPAAAATVKTTTEMPCTCGHDEEPMPQHHVHERTLSSNTSFSSPNSYASASTNFLPASNSRLSCDGDLGNLSSAFSSSSLSYESFYHIEEEALDDDIDGIGPCTTRPPAVQTMMPQKSRQRAEGGGSGGAGEYDPKRLPSSMFRTRSKNPAEWSATSNESLFSIQFSSNADDLADFYYDAGGFPRFPSLGRDAGAAALKQLPSSLTESSAGRSGGLCVRHDCARCVTGSKTMKSVRFAATESVLVSAGEGKNSVVVSTLEVEVEEMEESEAPAAAATEEALEAGWCELGCCLGSSSPTAWWPSFCRCNGCGCHCNWWF